MSRAIGSEPPAGCDLGWLSLSGGAMCSCEPRFATEFEPFLRGPTGRVLAADNARQAPRSAHCAVSFLLRARQIGRLLGGCPWVPRASLTVAQHERLIACGNVGVVPAGAALAHP